MATTSTKTDVLDVKLQVIEVKNLEFYIDFKKYSIEQSNNFLTNVKSTAVRLKSTAVLGRFGRF